MKAILLVHVAKAAAQGEVLVVVHRPLETVLPLQHKGVLVYLVKVKVILVLALDVVHGDGRAVILGHHAPVAGLSRVVHHILLMVLLN